MLIDTHCHLDDKTFDADRDEIVLNARASGIGKIVVPSVSVHNLSKVRACCSRYDLCLPAYGIHPLFVEASRDDDVKVLQQYLHHELSGEFPPVAIGEIGLDFFVQGADLSRQAFFFTEQLKIAREFDLPVLLHVRRAVDEVLKYLRRFGIGKGIAHAFNGSFQQAEALIKQGFKLGFGGAMTYPRATRIRKLATELPLESIVLETDAPDIAPAWLAGGRNTPQELLGIANTLAELRGVGVDVIIRAVSVNANCVVIPANRA